MKSKKFVSNLMLVIALAASILAIGNPINERVARKFAAAVRFLSNIECEAAGDECQAATAAANAALEAGAANAEDLAQNAADVCRYARETCNEAAWNEMLELQ